MPYLYVLNGFHRHNVFRVGEKPNGEVLGQRDDADIVLKDPWISWTHAKLVRAGAGLAIEDLGSTNGTYVNCEKVTRQALGEDDVVFLGRTHLLFVASNRPPSAPPASAAREAVSLLPEGRGAEGTARIVVPGARQEIPALDASQDSSLSVSDVAAPSEDSSDAEITALFRGPFAEVGKIDELDVPDDGDAIPLPPTAEVAYADAAQSDDHIEIDVEELGLTPLRPGAGEIGDAVRVHSIDASGEIDPLTARDNEIARLRAALAAREAEILRLRAELTKVKEQYLDL